jgi:alpha-tubulin suppressor-like RCC1 family protein
MSQPRQFSLQIATKPIWVTPGGIPAKQQDAFVKVVLVAKDALSFALQSGALPAGMTLSSAGQLAGTPTVAGTYTFTVRAIGEAANVFADQVHTIVIAPLPSWTTVTAPAQLVGDPASFQFEAQGALTYAVQSGSLPAGLSLSAGGLMTGTPTAVESASFGVRAASQSFEADRSFAIQVRAPPVWSTSAALQDAVQNAPLLVQLQATQAPAYYVASGSLPAGTTLSAEGVLEGTPTAAGTFVFDVLASNAPNKGTLRTFTIVVAPSPVWVTGDVLEFLLSELGSVQLSATNATSYAALGSLPAGLTLSAGGLLSGTPSSKGSFALAIRASASASVFAVKTFEITVAAVPVFATEAALPTAFLTEPASTLLVASDALSYATTAGALPPGITLSAAGELRGTYTSIGQYSATVRASGTASIAFADRAFTQLVVSEPVWVTTSPLSEILQAEPVSIQLNATYATSYSVVSGVVPGLSLSSAGLLTGSPVNAGLTDLVVRAATGNAGVYKDRTLQAFVDTRPVWVTAAGALAAAPQTLFSTFSFAATGALTYAVQSGTLPDGLTLSSAGTLSGTATTVESTSFTIRAYKASLTNFTDRAFTLQVSALPAWATSASLTDVAKDSAYSVTLQATNTVGYTLQSGALPAGLSLNSSTGALTGTPTTAGTATFTIRATRSPGVFADRTFTQIVALTPTWLTGATFERTKTVAVTISLVANDSTSYAVVAGALADGTSLSATGSLTGTPTTAGPATFTVRAYSTTSTLVYADRVFTITIWNIPTWTTAATLTGTPKDAAYSFQLAAIDAQTYSVTAGALPTGVSLSASGLLSGTPTVDQTATFTVTAQGGATEAIEPRAFTLVVATTPTWTTGASLANTAKDVAYSLTLLATNASATGFSVQSGSLPAGVTLSSAGVLSGTPTDLATYSFTVRVTSATSPDVFADRAFSLTTVPLPVWTTTSLADVAAGVVYSVQLAATNAISYALKTGTLPTGLSLSSGGLLSGTPSAAGSFSFTITATGDASNALTDQALTQLVAATPTWSTGASLANTAKDVAYSFTLVATNASATGYSVVSGALPAGVTLSSAGVLAGTPTASATYNFTVRALSTTSSIVFADRAFTLTTVPLPVWSTTSLTDVASGSAYSVQLVATNAVSFALKTGTLPTGLSLSSGGLISGTPSAAGSFSFTITATGDASNALTDQALIQLVATTPTWSTAAALTATAQSVAYSFTLVATNASATGYSLVSGTLPAGVTLSNAGVLSGTPTAATTYNFTVRALSTTSTLVFADRAFSLTTVPLPVWSSPAAGALTEVATGTAITTINFVATNATSYVVTVGALPAGLSLSSGGALTGTPSAAGSFSFTVTATGGATNATTDRSFSQVVTATPVWTTGATLTDIPDSTVVSFQFVATNAVSYALTAGSLPPGLSLSAGGLLTGTAGTTVASYSFTIRATGSSAVAFADRAFTQAIVSNLVINYIQYRGVATNAYTQSMVLGADGRAYACGNNTQGFITGTAGTGSNLMTPVPTVANIVAFGRQSPFNHTYAKDSSGQWWTWGTYAANTLGTGSTSGGTTTPITWNGVPNVVRMVHDGHTNGTSTFAQTTNGSWYRWGANLNGCLGTGNTTAMPTPTLFTGLSNIKQVEGCWNSGFVFVLENGDLYALGAQRDGAGTAVNLTSPTLIISNVKFFYGGHDGLVHFVLKNDGTIWCWGRNTAGQLGLGNTTIVSYTAPVRNTVVEALGTIKDISTSGDHTFVLLSTGVVKAVGVTNYYKNSTGNVTAFETVSGLPAIQYVIAQRTHSIFVTSSLQMYTSGDNGNFQCGFNTGNPRDPTLLTTTFTLAPIAVTPTWNTPAAFTMVSGTPKRLDASDAGTYYVQSGSLPSGMSLSTDGLISGNAIAGSYAVTIRAYGATSAVYADRAFTVTIGDSGIKKIETSNSYSLILTTDGSVYSVGASTVGSLGNAGATSYAVPTKITALSNIVDIACTSSQQSNAAVDSSGVLWCWGENSANSTTGTNTAVGTNITAPIQNTFLSGVTKLFGGENTIWAITNTGAVYMWCASYNWVADSATRMTVPAQKLGLPTNVASISCSGGIGVCCALTTTGDTWTFADTNSTNVWKNAWMGTGVTSNFNVPTKLSSGVAAVGHPNYVLVQLMTNGDVYHNGRFANNTYITSPVKNVEASGQGVVDLFGGYGSAYYMRTTRGALYYADYVKDNDWLDNTTMIIGSFVAIASPVPMTKFLTPTRRTTTGMLQGTDGKVYAIGSDSWSATDVTTNFSPVPRQVTVISNLLQSGTYNAATTKLRTFMTVQNSGSFFVGTDGKVYGCGANDGAQLTGTTGTTTNVMTQVPTLTNIVRLGEGQPGRPNFAKDSSGNWWAWGQFLNQSLGSGNGSQTSLAPSAWTYLANTERIISTEWSSFAKTTDGKWYRWGGNDNGQLGTGNINDYLGSPTLFTGVSNIKDVIAGAGQTFYVITNDGQLYVMGTIAKTSSVVNLNNPTFIMSGVAVLWTGHSNAVFVRKTDGTIWCWGGNSTGQLGLGNTTAVYADTMVRHTSLESLSIRTIVASGSATLIVLNDGTVLGMGNKARYKNGTGNDLVPTAIPGLTNILHADIDTSATFIDSSNRVWTSGSNANFQTGFNSGDPRDPTLLTTTFTLAANADESVPVWTTAADLSGAALNVALSKQLYATFGYSFALVSGSLPTGLTLSTAGVLSGTPTAAGSYSWTVRAFGGSTSAYADRTFAMDFSVAFVPDATFEAYKTAGTIFRNSGTLVYDLGAYSFLPTAGRYEFAGVDRTANGGQQYVAAEFRFSLFSGGTYKTYVIEGNHTSTLDGVAMTPIASSGVNNSSSVAINTNYYCRCIVTSGSAVFKLYTGFTPSTWTFTGEFFSREYAITADMGDVSMEAAGFYPDGSSDPQNVYSINTPVLALSGYQRGVRGAHGMNFLITSSGDIYGAGGNASGQLTGTVGAGTNTMTKVPTMTNMTHFCEGITADLTFAKDASGTWWSWGYRQAYERGDGAAGSVTGLVPAPFTALSNVSRIVSCTYYGKFAQTTDGTWYMWGNNNTGVLGTGNTTAVPVPTKFTALTGIADIFGWESGAGSCALFLLNDGKLYGTGDFNDGGGNRTSPVLISTGIRKVVGGQFALKTDGTWIGFGGNESGSLGVGNTTAVLVTAPVSHTFLNAAPVRYLTSWRYVTIVVRADGSVYGAGNRAAMRGSTGNATSFEQITGLPTNVAIGDFAGDNCGVYFATWNRSLYTAGLNGSSQAGFAASTSVTPTLLPLSFSLAPLSRAPTWNTAATILSLSAGGVVSQRLDATDARQYKIVSGALPTGLTLSIDGLITGTASTSGPYSFAVRAYGMTSGSIADRTFSWTVDSQALDTTFEAYKTAGTIAKVSNAYNLGAYSFLPTNGTYDFVVTDRSTTTTPGAAFSWSLFMGGTSSSGAYYSYGAKAVSLASADTLLLLQGDAGTIVDTSSAARTITNTGGVSLSTGQSKFGGKSLLFNGTANGNLTVASNASFAFGTGDFTVEAWVYRTGGQNAAMSGMIFTCGGDVNTGGTLEVFIHDQTFYCRVSSGGDLTASWPDATYNNRWTHIAAVRASGTLTLYIDGVAVASGSRPATVTKNTPVIGRRDGPSDMFFAGYIDDLRVAPSATYTGNFAPASSAFVLTAPSLVTANVDYYARLRIEATQMTYTLHNTFTPGTWTFGAPIMTQTFAINASDVSLENMQVTTNGVGTLQNVYSVNTPVMLTFTPYYTSVSGNSNGGFLVASAGDVYFTGNNSSGGMSGVVGSASNGLTKITGLSGISHMGEGQRNTTFQFARTANGVWWQWGTYAANEQGTGSTTTGTIAPTIFSPAYTFVRIVSVGTNKFAKTSAGQWYCWGPNGNGVLGLGNTTAVSSPTPFGALSGIRDILGGNNSGTFFWLDNGAVYFSGNANDGGGNRTTPVQLLTSVQRLFAGGNGSYHAQKTDGTWWSAGWNPNGQLGIGNTTTLAVTSPVRNNMLEASPVRMIHVGQDSMMVVRASGAVVAAGNIPSYRNSTGNAISGETLVIANQVATAYIEYGNMFATTWDGKVFSSGINTNFQTGNTSNTTTKDPSQLTLGFTMAPLSRAPTWVTATALTVMSVGATVSIRLDATDARLYKVISGTFPPGLSLAADGLITGAVSTAGSYAWTVRAFGMTSGAYADRTFTATAGNVVAYANVASALAAASSSSNVSVNGSNELSFSSTSSIIEFPLAHDLSYSTIVVEFEAKGVALNGTGSSRPIVSLWSGSSSIGNVVRYWNPSGTSTLATRKPLSVYTGTGIGTYYADEIWAAWYSQAGQTYIGRKELTGIVTDISTSVYQKWTYVASATNFKVYFNDVLYLNSSADFPTIVTDFRHMVTKLRMEANGTTFLIRNLTVRNYQPVSTYANVSAVLAAATTATSVSVNGSNELAFTATNSALYFPLTFDLASDTFVMNVEVRFTALNGSDNQQPIFELFSGASSVGAPIRFWTSSGYSAINNKIASPAPELRLDRYGSINANGRKSITGYVQPTAAYQKWTIQISKTRFVVAIDDVVRYDNTVDFPSLTAVDMSHALTQMRITANGTTMTVRNMTISSTDTPVPALQVTNAVAANTATSTTGTFTVAPGMTRMYMFGAAGGGGSAIAFNQDGGHGAGGGGACNISGYYVTVAPGEVYSYSVGGGGAGASSNNSGGSAGGATTVTKVSNSTVVFGLNGGSGGQPGSGSTGGAGGAGGTVAVGTGGVSGGNGGTGGSTGISLATNGTTVTNAPAGGGGGGAHNTFKTGGTGGTSTVTASTFTKGGLTLTFLGTAGGTPGTVQSAGNTRPAAVGAALGGFGTAQDANTGAGGGPGAGIKPVVNGAPATNFHGGGGGGNRSYLTTPATTTGSLFDGTGGDGFLIVVTTNE